ncbi:MAG: hypothetical protein WBM41_19020, partial [Arenicellales bacterium]
FYTTHAWLKESKTDCLLSRHGDVPGERVQIKSLAETVVAGGRDSRGGLAYFDQQCVAVADDSAIDQQDSP